MGMYPVGRKGSWFALHMRRKKWARPELADCPWYTGSPEESRGRWRTRFPHPERPLWLELGCGKGVSTAQLCRANPEVNFIAMDISPDVLGDARRNITAAWAPEPVENMYLVRRDITRIREYFSPEDGISRIYINFCNPWPRRRHHKRRLTHPRQLLQYRGFLTKDGEIWFKTDDDELFAHSLRYFAESGYEAVRVIEDLHASGFAPNYVSEHEAMFSARGVPIKFGIFRVIPGWVPAYEEEEDETADGIAADSLLSDSGRAGG